MIDQPPDEQPMRPPQFGLKTLVILQGLVAVAVAMFVSHRVAGFLTLLVLTHGLILVRVRPEREPLRRVCFDLLMGIVMPIVGACISVDSDDLPETLIALAIVAWLPMLTLIFWLLRDLRHERVGQYIRGFVAGIFVVWGLAVGVIGPMMSAFVLWSTLEGSKPVVNIALDFATSALLAVMVSFVLMRNADRALEGGWNRHAAPFPARSFALGIFLAVALPGAVIVVVIQGF